MSLSNDDLRLQLERRTKAATLDPVDRATVVEAVHAQASAPRPASRRWLAWAAIPSTAGLLAVLLLVALALPRTPPGPPASTTPAPATATAGMTPTPAPTLTAAPVVGPISAEQLVALAGDPSMVGTVAVSDAEVSFEPSPTQFDVPEIQVIGPIRLPDGQSVTVMGYSYPDTSQYHAFRVIPDGRLEYLGPVVPSAGGFAWTVPAAIAAAPPGAAYVLYPVEGWLLQTVAAPCMAPPEMGAPQDYWCGGSWIASQPVSTADGSMVQLTIPGAIHVQWDAYREFADDPQFVNGGEPRFGTYLVRPAGCPPNVMGDCPVWEMVGRLDAPTNGSAATPSPPTATPTAGAAPTVAPTPVAPAPTYPVEWPASLRDALSARALVFAQVRSDDTGHLLVGNWPFTKAYTVDQHYPDTSLIGTAGHEAVVLHKTAQDIEIVLTSGSTGVSRVLGHFPLSDEWSGEISLDGLQIFVHGSSGDVNDPQAKYVDHGIVAWDVATGTSRTVLAPASDVATRWDLHVSPDKSTVASGRSAQDGSFAYDVVNRDGSVHSIHPLTENLTIDAITTGYAIGFARAFDPDLNTTLERHVLVDLRDGSQRLVPAKADALIENCETCLQYGVGPSWVIDDSHFLLIRSKLWLLDASDNVARAVYDLTGSDLRPYNNVSPVLSSEWFLVTDSPYGEPVHLVAVNLVDGTLVDLGIAQ